MFYCYNRKWCCTFAICSLDIFVYFILGLLNVSLLILVSPAEEMGFK